MYLRGRIPDTRYPAKTEADRLDSLEIRSISYRHPETGRGIQEVGLDLTRGSFTVVTGRVGSGKTTMIETLLGLLAMDSGDVLSRERGHVAGDHAGVRFRIWRTRASMGAAARICVIRSCHFGVSILASDVVLCPDAGRLLSSRR